MATIECRWPASVVPLVAGPPLADAYVLPVIEDGKVDPISTAVVDVVVVSLYLPDAVLDVVAVVMRLASMASIAIV